MRKTVEFKLVLEDALKREAKSRAALWAVSLNQFIVNAIQHYLETKEKP
jgi:predicted HicB family RNase H-like nuclease